jgi:endoglucanase
VAYRVATSWPSGFSADVTITNTRSTQLTGWTLAFTFPGNQHIASAWNGVAAQTGADVVVRKASYNGPVPPGGTVSFGFQANYGGSNTNPTTFDLNGTRCTLA